MQAYEVMYITKSNQDAIDDALKLVKGTIVENNGIIEKVDQWGTKTLAYPIGEEDKGHYTLITFTGTPSCVSEANRKMINSEDILRHMFVRKGE